LKTRPKIRTVAAKEKYGPGNKTCESGSPIVHISEMDSKEVFHGRDFSGHGGNPYFSPGSKGCRN
jgi:hypothetical protein